MTRPSRLRRALLVVLVVAGAVAAGPTPGVRAEECRDVVSSARANAAFVRVDAANGAGLAVPATYSQLVYDSIPTVAYNQAGPTTLSQLEDPTGTNPNTLLPTVGGFLPVDLPVPLPDDAFGDDPPFLPAPPIVGRSEAAYPPLEGIPQDSENSAGPMRSEAHAYPTYSQGRASTAALEGVRSGSAFTHATMECETLTLVVGWRATGVVTAGGTIPSMSQIATLVVTPDGASVDVATNIADETEEGLPILEGRPLDPITDPFNAQGTYVDVGEPRIAVEDAKASVSGGGIRVGTADPSRSDTFTFVTIGSLEGSVEHLSILPPVSEPRNPGVDQEPTTRADDVSAPGGQTTTVITETAGQAPEPSGEAEQFAADQIQLAGLTQDLTTGSYSLWPFLLGLLALGLIARVAWFGADRSRERFPTAGFAVDWFRERGRRFATTYLEW